MLTQETRNRIIAHAYQIVSNLKDMPELLEGANPFLTRDYNDFAKELSDIDARITALMFHHFPYSDTNPV